MRQFMMTAKPVNGRTVLLINPARRKLSVVEQDETDYQRKALVAAIGVQDDHERRIFEVRL